MFYKRISDLQPYYYNNLVHKKPNNDNEKLAASLWLEVALSLDDSGQPTPYPYHIQKYQSKRINVFDLLGIIDITGASTSSVGENFTSITATNISCTNLTATNITATQISTSSITADSAQITNITSTNISTNEITSQNGHFTNITVTGKAQLTAEAAYWADIAEIYTADKGYLYGTLVKFGGEKEITIADDKANAVVSENPAIVLNTKNKDENALPIVLTGRSKVRTIHQVKKFDKIYLSETPGVGSISSYKASTASSPIGIALESKPYDEEGLVECILQLNFD